MTVSTLAPRARRRMEPPKAADRVTQYALDVLAGRVVVGELVRKAAERHVSDLATGAAARAVVRRRGRREGDRLLPAAPALQGRVGTGPGEAEGRSDRPRGLAGVHRRLGVRLEA
jgi:hypothetical protein